MELIRERLNYERPIALRQEQTTIEGEATLTGSMRDAVTVLDVQAKAHVTDAKTTANGTRIQGHVAFRVLYTQGDLTRVRTLETGCDFEHDMMMEETTPGMRVWTGISVEQTEGIASSGRIRLKARVKLQTAVFQQATEEPVAQIADGTGGIQTKMQEIQTCGRTQIGQGSTLVREEFELDGKTGDVLGATATIGNVEIAGGSGRIGVTGVIEARVTHRAEAGGQPFVITRHEMPFEMSVDTAGWNGTDGENISATAEVTDMMADSTAGDRKGTLRLEAEIRVTLTEKKTGKATILEDAYSLTGPMLEPVFEETKILVDEAEIDVRESTRIQVTLPEDVPPIDTVLAAFAQPMLTDLSPSGRRANAEGIMEVTLVYLPVDSDIPCGIRVREPFSMTFPAEVGEETMARMESIETSVAATTSDRAELRCEMELKGIRHAFQTVRLMTDIRETENEKTEHGFVVLWPRAGESQWETAKTLRVPEEKLRFAGKNAVIAFKN